MHLFVPWTIHEYPGPKRLLAEWLGVKRSTVDNYLYKDKLPAKHALTLERICRERAAAFLALADDLARGRDQGF